MYWVFFVAVSVTIPEGWPMLRANQQRTGYVPGYSCFTDTCQLKWGLLIQNSEGDIIETGPISADFDSDGKKDVLIGAACYGGFPIAELYRGENGDSMWSAGFTGFGPKYNSPALMEVTGDGIPEVFIHDNTSGDFRALNGTNGMGLWVNSSVWADTFSAPLVIEGGTGTVIVGDDNGTLWCLDATTGGTNWSQSIGTYIQPPSYGDVDGDGTPDIVVVAGSNLWVFELGGSLKWNTNTGSNATTPALANLDGDPELEITIYNYQTGYVRSYNYGNATPFIDVSIGSFTPQHNPNPTTPDYWPPSLGLQI